MPPLKPIQTLPELSSPNDRAKASLNNGKPGVPARLVQELDAAFHLASPFVDDEMLDAHTLPC